MNMLSESGQGVAHVNCLLSNNIFERIGRSNLKYERVLLIVTE